MSKARPITLAALAAILVAVMGATVTDLGDWYQHLSKPAWQPPDWLFGPAWTLIYATTTVSAAQGWASAPRDSRYRIVAVFCFNGFLNVLWSLLFFRLQRPDWALVEVTLLWLSIVGLMVVQARFSSLATWLLTPYLLWVAFAGYLNLAIVRLNGPF